MFEFQTISGSRPTCPSE